MLRISSREGIIDTEHAVLASDRGVLRLTVGIMRAVAILAAVVLLAGCPGNGASGIGQTGYSATDGNGANNALVVKGDGGTGGDGNGFGANGSNANGSNANGSNANGSNANGSNANGSNANGGNANGGTGGNGGTGSPGADGVSGADGASGGGNSGSGSVAGSGRLVSRVIAVPGVSSVVVGASFVVRLTIGETEQATIHIDDNLADLIDATVTDGVLRLGLKPGSNVRNATLSAEVTVRDLDRLTTSGASQISGPVQVDHLEASTSGASTLALSGRVRSLRLTAAGASKLRGLDLTVADLDAVLSGASHATVTVTGTLAATAGGASVLRYRATPTITRQQTSGTSSIEPD